MLKKLLLVLTFVPFIFATSLSNAATWTSLSTSNPGFSYSVSPADAILFLGENPGPQSPAVIKTLVETQFGLTSPLTFVGGCESTTSGCTAGDSATEVGSTNTFFSDIAFNYLAIHFGGSELLFYWDDAINQLSISDYKDLTGGDSSMNAKGKEKENGGGGGLSNYRAFSDGISEVPLPAAGWLFGSALVGLMGFRRKMH